MRRKIHNPGVYVLEQKCVLADSENSYGQGSAESQFAASNKLKKNVAAIPRRLCAIRVAVGKSSDRRLDLWNAGSGYE